ncbi:MAG: hypothetical protein J07HX64_00501 [halophilic archaeon J07HX64]|nr:MAG: hypothetical protein J07HX64_00501 [halophilic archaeon J07HX64]
MYPRGWVAAAVLAGRAKLDTLATCRGEQIADKPAPLGLDRDVLRLDRTPERRLAPGPDRLLNPHRAEHRP